MAVYVDPLMDYGRNWGPGGIHRKSCHMIADSEEELIAFGKSIGISAHWIQRHPTRPPHFDLPPYRREQAVRAGALEISLKELVRRMRPEGTKRLDQPAPAGSF